MTTLLIYSMSEELHMKCCVLFFVEVIIGKRRLTRPMKTRSRLGTGGGQLTKGSGSSEPKACFRPPTFESRPPDFFALRHAQEGVRRQVVNSGSDISRFGFEMLKKQKILVCGDVNGNFKTLFSRVNTINEKSGPFDFLFCVGDFFGDSAEKLEPYKKGILSVPVPTYILGPNRSNHVSFYEDLSGGEICPNLSCLGKHGILTSGGIRIAYISGLEGGKDKTETTFTEKDAVAVRDAALKVKDGKQFLGVDVLLSSQWPSGVTRFHKESEDSTGSKTLAWLACQLKPRYHFCGVRDVFYERPPYKNCSSLEDGHFGHAHSTRFIGLAKVGNAAKNKWLYAANLTPLSSLRPKDLYQSTTDETECPYAELTKVRDCGSGSQFFYDVSATEDVAPKKRRKHSSSESEKKFDDPETCWFCLASSSVEKHLVISIGEEVYVALAKGGLTPLHAMIVPIKHYRCQTELSKNAADEVKKYKCCLRRFLKERGLVPVVFERNYKTSHMQLHIVPVPDRVSADLKHLFVSASEERGLQLSELPNKAHLKDFAQPGTPYFYIELPTKNKLFCPCRRDFPINFGRDVLAGRSVLNMPDRINWRNCTESRETEEKMAQDFRSEFESFDEVS